MKSTNGFSTVEVVVAISIGAIFLMSAIMLSITIEKSMANTRYKAVASDVAYRYLRKYVSVGTRPTWFTCSSASGSSNTNDVTVNPNASGQVVESGTLTGSSSGLPEPVAYEVRAVAAYGCSGANAGTPLLITSSVTYGPNNRIVEHATYEGY